MIKEELQKKLQEKAQKIVEFAKTLHVTIGAQLSADPSGIKPLLVFKDNETYEESTPKEDGEKSSQENG